MTTRLLMTCAGACALAVAFVLLSFAASAEASFPYLPNGGNPHDFTTYHTNAGTTPDDLTGGLVWKYASTPEAGNLETNANPQELNGVRGAHLADAAPVPTAWQTTTGRPDVAIAVLDSGIKWNDEGAMKDLRAKIRLNRGELPVPAHDRGTALVEGVDCSHYSADYDADGNGVVNLLDYACDARVQNDWQGRAGPKGMLVPQDLLKAFSDGDDADGNGFVDDIAGWDFLDDDNDAYDDVQYGHGTGEAEDSNAEADNGGALGSCPNCMVVPLRVGDSFVADVNRFAQAVLYATDNGMLVIQEALGTLNNSKLARGAVNYAYRHGVTVIASAADEAAQHHNWPSSLPHVIVVNSVRIYDETFTPVPRSYLQFNGCTNFSSKITVAIPSTSCSSEATGRGAGMAGLIYSAALNARAAGKIGTASTADCRRVGGDECVITPNEVRQLMASGSVAGKAQADDVSFAIQPEPSCSPLPHPTCTDPFLGAPGNYAVVSPIPGTRRYPARKGHDQFYGYGRVNMVNAVDAVAGANVPPQAEIESPDWFAQVDPAKASVSVDGTVSAREDSYTCQLYVAPGSYPNNSSTEALPPGDFKPVGGGWCDGSERTGRHEGSLGSIDIADLKSRFPSTSDSFTGPEQGSDIQRYSGRPDVEPYGFVVKVVVKSSRGPTALTGEDRRNLYLHRDADLLPGWPKQLPSDGASSPVLADLNGDNRNELLLATSDGVVHAYKPDGKELKGWPVRGDRLPLHTGQPAFTSGEVNRNARGAILASLAVGDLDRDGSPEVVAADFEGKVYAWRANGKRRWTREAVDSFSGKPLAPFVNARKGHRNRTQHGFLGSPVLADVDGDKAHRLEVVAAGMDRHLYVWRAGGKKLPGFPMVVVDPSKVASIDPSSHQVTFNANAGEDELNQGAIIDTPAVGDIDGDKKPEIVVGTNEEYAIDAPGEGGLNAGNFNTASLAALAGTDVLSFGNTRVFAIKATGDSDGDGNPLTGPSPFVKGWPVKLATLFTELLPVVGEGVTGSPVIGPVTCPSGGKGQKIGTMPDAGPSYIFNADGSSCFGKDPTNGQDIALQSDLSVTPKKADVFAYSTVGQPAFADFGGGMSYLAPATGLLRAVDLAANEYQGGQDYLAAWDAQTGQFRPGFPANVNDLQFLGGPSVADIDGKSGQEAVGGTAYLDLQAFDGSGNPVPGWPKLTSDWTVSAPAIGSFGSVDTSSSARKRVASVTRSGRVLVYATDAPACSPSSSPHFHHDIANSGWFERDAVDPGKPMKLKRSGGSVSFIAPGDDLLCGRARRYEVVQSNGSITGASFKAAAVREAAASLPKPAEPGERQTVELPPLRKRNVGIRAVDEQGNVGPVAIVRKSRARMRLSVSPKRVRAGKRVHFHFRVLRAGGKKPVAGVKITFAGHTAKTGKNGRATITAKLKRRGRYAARAARSGFRPVRAFVRSAAKPRSRFTG